MAHCSFEACYAGKCAHSVAPRPDTWPAEKRLVYCIRCPGYRLVLTLRCTGGVSGVFSVFTAYPLLTIALGRLSSEWLVPGSFEETG